MTHLNLDMENEKIPGSALKANPHIESRMKMLKKHYFELIEMMAASGFGWNEKDKMIMVDKHIYQEWIKSHPNATGIYNKSFQHFEELGAVFGKDRSHGGNAEDLAQAVATMEVELETQLNGVHVNQNTDPSFEEIEVEFQADYEVPKTSRGMSSSSSQSRNKRKRESKGSEVRIEALESVVETMSEIKTAHLGESTGWTGLVSCFKRGKEGADMRRKILVVLREVDDLSLYERLKAVVIISKDTGFINTLFFCIPGGILAFVKMVLNCS